jgi:hypothetical protein
MLIGKRAGLIPHFACSAGKVLIIFHSELGCCLVLLICNAFRTPDPAACHLAGAKINFDSSRFNIDPGRFQFVPA